MSDADTATQGADSGADQDPIVDQTQEQEMEASAGDVVPKQELQKVLDDMHKFKKQAREFEAQLKTREMNELKQREEWQKIAELKEQEAEQFKTEAQQLKESFLAKTKYDALKQAALANGIRKDALSDLELLSFDDDVAIETTSTGKVNVLGAENAIKKLKSQRPYWFGKSIGNVNSDSPETVAGKAMTTSEIIKLQAEARKTGDWSKVQKAIQQYRSQ